MFATRSQDGMVRIWEAGAAPPTVTGVDGTGLDPRGTISGLPESESPKGILLPLPEGTESGADEDEAM
jgi:hypothetical protein